MLIRNLIILFIEKKLTMPSTHFLNELNTLGKSELAELTKLIEHRLQIIHSEEYYLHIPVSDLPFAPCVMSALMLNNIHSVRELMLYDLEKLKYFRGIGEKRFQHVKRLLAKLEEGKEKIKTLTGDALAAVLKEM